MVYVLYSVAIILIAILERAIMPGLMPVAYTPFIWLLFSIFILAKRPKTEALFVNTLLAAVLGLLSGNLILLLVVSLLLYAFYWFFTGLFGAPNKLLFVAMSALVALYSSLIILFATIGKESIFAGFGSLKVVLLKTALTALTAFILTPVLNKFVSLVATYEVRVRLPR